MAASELPVGSAGFYGLELGRAIDRLHENEDAIIDAGEKEKRWRREADRILEAKVWALRAMVGSLPARSAADALAIAIMALDPLSTIESSELSEYLLRGEVQRALDCVREIVRFLAESSGIAPKAMGIAFFDHEFERDPRAFADDRPELEIAP